MDFQKRKKCRPGTWFYASVANWIFKMKALHSQMGPMNVRLQGWGLSGLYDWINPAYIIREKSVVSLEDPVMIF